MQRLRLPANFEPSFTNTTDNKEYMRIEDEFAERIAQEEINKMIEDDLIQDFQNLIGVEDAK